MKRCLGLLGAFTMVVALVMAAAPEQLPSAASSGESSPMPSDPDHGRYLVTIGGCNDCHTHGFTAALGKVPESDWLTGDTIGWWGPWGTTYPTNLRLLLGAMSEETWVNFARQLKTRPPMAWWVLHEMHEPDLRAVHGFVKRLGPKGEPAPSDLPPGRKPPVPYVEFVLGKAGQNS